MTTDASDEVNDPANSPEIDADSGGSKSELDDAAYWNRAIAKGKKAAKRFWEIADLAWAEFLGDRKRPSTARIALTERTERNPVWWSAVRTVQPAIYARTPKVVSTPRFNTEDPVARLACILDERFCTHLMERSEFDNVMFPTRDDFILAGRGVPRVFYEAEIKQGASRMQVYPQYQGEQLAAIYDSQGNALPDGDYELQQDEATGEWWINQPEISRHNACLIPLNYRDFVHNASARYWNEIDWVAFRNPMTKREFKKKFPEYSTVNLSFTETAEEKVPTAETKNQTPEEFCIVWEIWCKIDRKVRFVVEGHDDKVIRTEEDPYQLECFFPIPHPVYSSHKSDSLYPVPDFWHVKEFIAQLNTAWTRFNKMLRAVRRRALADKDVRELQSLTDSANDADVIFVPNMSKIVGEKGGLQNMVQYLPVQELVAAINEIVQITNTLEEWFARAYGIPDILRGSSDPNETASAQQLKGQFATLRFEPPMKDFQRLCRDAIRMVRDLAYAKYDDQSIAEITGVAYMKPEEQQLFPQALNLLRNDRARFIQTDLETDSTIAEDEAVETAQQREAISTIVQGLQQVVQLSQQSKSGMMLALKLLMGSLKGLRKGKEYEQDIKSFFDGQMRQMEQAAQNPQQPPPDYQQQALDIEKQKVVVREQEVQGKLQLQAQKQQQDSQKDMADTALDNKKMDLETQIQNAYLALDKLKVQLTSMERLLEEKRLATDAALEARTREVEALAEPILGDV